jgi:16S rRNA (cytidine1402-2'-O)-methyltransferase
LSPPQGNLYLVPAPLDLGCSTQSSLEQVMPQATLETAQRLRYWICENAKSARAYLKRVKQASPNSPPLQELLIQQLPHEVHKKGDHAGGFDAKPLLAPALAGHDMGLLSEAGMPAVADPGASVVRAAHDLGLAVVPLVGPVSILLALAASGLSGQSFAFVGYLPKEAEARTQRIRELEALALRTGQTQLFIETPYRNTVLLQSLLQTLRADTRLSVAVGLTLPDGTIRSEKIQTWRKNPSVEQSDAPMVFALGP